GPQGGRRRGRRRHQRARPADRDDLRRGRLRRALPGLRPGAVDDPPPRPDAQGRRGRGGVLPLLLGPRLPRRRLARAGDVGDVRHRLRRPPRDAPPVPAGRVRGPPPAEGLPAPVPGDQALARPGRRRADARRGTLRGRRNRTRGWWRMTVDFRTEALMQKHLADARINVELETEGMVLNLGPQHPATHGTLRVVVKLDGERVVSADPVIGYMHRGYEKLTEFRTYPQITTLINRIDWLSSFANEVPFIHGAEMLMGVEAPPRAEYIRTILTELSRIATFVLFLGEMALQVGAITPAFYGFRDREHVLNLIEAATGGRFHPNFNRIGGLKVDLPSGWIDECRRVMKKIFDSVDEFEDLVVGNEIFEVRTRGI